MAFSPKYPEKTQLKNNFILVDIDLEAEMNLPSGLVLAGMRNDQGSQGIVVAAGPGEHDSRGAFVPLDWIKVGDRVYFDKNKETGLNRPRGIFIEDHEYVYLDAHGVLAILEED